MGTEHSMMRRSTRWLGMALLGVMVCPLQADTIQLKSGHKVQGEVLKETEREVYVDIGVDVVRIPVDRILSREAGDGATSDTKGATDGGSDEVFRTANLPFKSVKRSTAKGSSWSKRRADSAVALSSTTVGTV